MKTLATPQDCLEILHRLGAVAETDRPIWGRMTVHQMLCHLTDSYSFALGERTASPAPGLLQRTMMKWVGLYGPMRWPRGVSTRPEIEQGVGGTPPVEFQTDRAKLTAIIHRFAEAADLASIRHPIFGRMSYRDWLRWGYLHADHHFRQFGR